ncbi:uncharacterized protein NEMAJ01_1028 [Nematocida major]|uniref:uncharacterized protein n=1 Tax=Nematocida major TaxID=1912982 RepID=UPI00200739F3|nr:uncharacterized protein NEMAJ01_1028 [Nematocida major]KAH9386132.1 hypothetical protein NEMAJ01_1028 [Nematocida major]
MEKSLHASLYNNLPGPEVSPECKRVPETKNPTSMVLKVLSSCIKETLRDIPEEKRAEIEVLVDTFLPEALENTFRTIVKKHCVISPEAVEFLAKEASKDAVIRRVSQELSSLARKIDAFILNQKIAYEKYIDQAIAENVQILQSVQSMCNKAGFIVPELLYFEAAKKFNTQPLKEAAEVQKKFFRETTARITQLLEEKKIAEKALRSYRKALEENEEEERRLSQDYAGSDVEKYALEKAFDKFRAYCSHGDNTPNNPALKSGGTDSECVRSIQEVAGKLSEKKQEEFLGDARAYAEKCERVKKGAQDALDEAISYFHDGVDSGIFKCLEILIDNIDDAIKNLQEPETMGMRELQYELIDVLFMLQRQMLTRFHALQGKLMDSYLSMPFGSAAGKSARSKFAYFTCLFDKILEIFPNEEIKPGTDNNPNSLSPVFKKIVSESKERMQALERELASFDENTSEKSLEEKARFYYACLMEFRKENSRLLGLIKEKIEASMAPGPLKVTKNFEEIPNNPEIIEKAKKMLEETLQKDPQGLLSSKFIVQNKHFLAELPKVAKQLDKRVAEALGERLYNGARRGRQTTLRHSLFGAFSIFIILSWGLMYSFRTALKK